MPRTPQQSDPTNPSSQELHSTSVTCVTRRTAPMRHPPTTPSPNSLMSRIMRRHWSTSGMGRILSLIGSLLSSCLSLLSLLSSSVSSSPAHCDIIVTRSGLSCVKEFFSFFFIILYFHVFHVFFSRI